MNDLELMELLESEGYEATVENLLILKESIETGEIEILDEATSLTKKMAKNGGRDSFEYQNASRAEKKAYHAYETGHRAAKLVAGQRNANQAGDRKASKALATKASGEVELGRAQKTHVVKAGVKAEDTGNHNKVVARKTVSSETKNKGALGALEKSDRREVHAVKSDFKKAAGTLMGANSAAKKYIKESYSDYELYQILEFNNFDTTVENLEILKEGLENGKYFLED